MAAIAKDDSAELRELMTEIMQRWDGQKNIEKSWLEAVRCASKPCMDVIIHYGIDQKLLNAGLQQAARQGDLQCIQHLLTKGACFDISIASISARCGHLQCIKYFMQNCSVSAYTLTRIMKSSLEVGHTDIFYHILLYCEKDYTNSTEYDVSDVIPLACKYGDKQAVQTLLKMETFLQGYPESLILAIRNHNRDLIKMLLDCGADVNCKTPHREFSPLIELSLGSGASVANLNQDDPIRAEIGTVLLTYGANTEQVDWNKRSALSYATENNFTQVVKLLIDAGANVNSYDMNYIPSIYHSIRRANVAITNILLEAGGDPDGPSYANPNALMLAIITRRLSGSDTQPSMLTILKQLICAGANVNRLVFSSTYYTGNSWIPLTAAAKYGFVDFTECLFLAGSDTSIVRLFYKSYENYLSCSVGQNVLTEEQFLVVTNPLPLNVISRCKIRRSFERHNIRLLEKLPVPKLVIKYLQFSDLNAV